MKIKILICLLALLMALPLTAAPPKGKFSSKVLIVDNTTYIDANKIFMFVTNHGNFARDLSDYFGYDYGAFYPYAGDPDPINEGDADAIRSPLYAAGLWVGAIDSATGETRVIISEYNDEYRAGPMVDDTAATDQPEFRTYKLYANRGYNDPNQDWTDYMTYAVPMGAPVKDTVIEGGATIQVPDMVGTQMLWAVYNDADPDQHANNSGETAPLGLEVRQTTFAFNREDPLGHVAFLKWQVFNKGNNTLQNCFFSIWSDPDLGGSGDDLVGVDTLLSLGYTYNANNNDQFYGSTPPVIGFDFFQGPLQYTGDMSDTARSFGTLVPGYINMGVYSFNKYINGTDPDNFGETYNYMRGLNRDGSEVVNPVTGEVTTFQMSGDPRQTDPVARGWTDTSPADRRMMQSTGPITFRPGDSTEILAAIVVGMGGDRLSSLSVMKYYDRFAQSAYDVNFEVAQPPASPVVSPAIRGNQITLVWTDTSEVNPGDYPFQGYSVYQGEATNGPWKLIANYDVVDGDAQVLDEVLDPLTGALETRAVKLGTDNGITRHFIADQDYINGGPLNNVTEYFFRVEAYSYDAVATPKTLTSANQTPLRLRPQIPVAGTATDIEARDTLAVTHTAGGSDGIVYPLVIDPLSLTGDTYQISFANDTSYATHIDSTIYDSSWFTTDTCDVMWDTLGDSIIIIYCEMYQIDSIIVDTSEAEIVRPFWSLDNTTTGQNLVDQWFNQEETNDYPQFDGLMLKVMGPSFGVNLIQEVADASGPITADNVKWSLNSTHDWYIGSDQGSNFARMDWRGLIGTADWEIRFTAGGSEYYDWASEVLQGDRCPFEFWNIGIGTPDDPSDDVRIQISFLDDDGSGGWSYGDRIYPSELPYSEPHPAGMDYTWPDDFRIGRIQINDYSVATTQPAEGTIIRFTTFKVNTFEDVFTFSTTAPTLTSAETDLDAIKAVPNPFYMYGGYDPSPGSKRIAFHSLPDVCTIKIFNIAGDLIRTLDKDDASTSIAFWDVQTERGLPIASGIYIYVVEAPGFGAKIGKMAVFVENEVLKIY